MSNNLPPGVSESDIPGNRPEDIIYDRIYEKLPVCIQDEIENESKLGKVLEKEFQNLVPKLFTEQDLLLEMQCLEAALREQYE